MKTILLLTISNAFMNLAWYGHLRFKNESLWLVILASWGLALFEYIFQVLIKTITVVGRSEPAIREANAERRRPHHSISNPVSRIEYRLSRSSKQPNRSHRD